MLFKRAQIEDALRILVFVTAAPRAFSENVSNRIFVNVACADSHEKLFLVLVGVLGSFDVGNPSEYFLELHTQAIAIVNVQTMLYRSTLRLTAQGRVEVEKHMC